MTAKIYYFPHITEWACLPYADAGGAATFGIAESPSLGAVLQTPHGSGKYSIETRRHIDLVEALGLPSLSAGLGYAYLQRGDKPGVSRDEFVVTAPAAANNRWRGP